MIYLILLQELVALKDYLAFDSDSTALYNVKYRYRTNKDYTAFRALPSDLVSGYYTEASFDDNGNLIVSSATKETYTSDENLGYIKVNLSPNAYSRFVKKIDKGDILGVQTLTNFNNFSYNLQTGVSKNYLPYRDWETDRKSTRLNSSHSAKSRMPSSA